MGAAITVAVTVAVGLMMLTRIDRDEAAATTARRGLRGLGMRLTVGLAVSRARDARAPTVHECDVGGARGPGNGRGRTRGRPSIEDSLLAAL
jgi:hypothetical protein